MIIKLWDNFITSGLDIKKNNLKTIVQIKSVNIYSFIGMIMLVIHVIFNFLSNNFVTGLIEIFLLFLLILNVIYLRWTKKPELLKMVLLIGSIVLISTIFISGGIYNTGILWIYYYPLMAFFLKRKKAGFLWIMIYLSVLIGITLLNFIGLIKIPYSYLTLRQAFLSFIVIVLFAYIYEDVKEKNEKIIKMQIFTDPLTKLPNRFCLLEDIKKMRMLQLLLIDIDDFKEINNFYGGNIGDKLLIKLAEKLESSLHGSQFKLYKLHADEYAVLIRNKMTEKDLRELVVYLNTTIIHKFFKIKNHEITVNLTISIATGKKNILENVDMALKFAKIKKRNYMFFNKKMRLPAKYGNNLEWINKLKKAITENKIIPYFQPIYSTHDKQIKEYECLARLIDNNGKIISPALFINIAKKAKLCTYITRIMIKKSIEVFKDNNYTFSINLVVDDMLNTYTVAYIKKLLQDHKIGNRIVFEILESESIENYHEVSFFIKEMKKLGCRIAIDDFGVGYSNFQHILKLDVDYLKIDASLIMNIHKDKNAQAIVESIVKFTRKLNVKTVAEFVYTRKVYNKVKSLNVDYLQGYYFSPPLPKLVSKK